MKKSIIALASLYALAINAFPSAFNMQSKACTVSRQVMRPFA